MSTDVRLARQAWADDQGFYSLPETMSLLNVSADELKALIKSNTILVLRGPDNTLHVPAFQFESGEPLEHLSDVVEALPTGDLLSIGAFLTHPDDDPRYKRLRRGEVESVVEEACQVDVGQ